MPKPAPWILGAAALALTAAAAGASEQTARNEAAEDSAKAQSKAEPGKHRRHVHVYRHGDDMMVMRGAGTAEHLSDILQLRPEQQSALKAFLDATRSEKDGREHMVKLEPGGERSTLQRLDQMEGRLTEQQAVARRKIAAIRTFYSQLDAKQQKAFDALPMLMMVGPSLGPTMIPHPAHLANNMPERPVRPKRPEPPTP